ncbi:MAG: CvpA family protein [Flavobacteriaceae bacterium]
MNGIDLIVLLFLGYGLISGFIKGIVVEIAGIIALILGLVGASKFSTLLGEFLSGYVNWNLKTVQIVSFILLFVVIIYVVGLLAKMITKTLKIIALGWINKLLGGVFGLVKWCVILSALALIIEGINEWIPLFPESSFQGAISYSYLKNLGELLFEGLAQSTPLVKQQLI